MPIDSSLFLDVSDTLGMGNPAIVKKIIMLLRYYNYCPHYHQIHMHWCFLVD
jgi:hypothetical protein